MAKKKQFKAEGVKTMAKKKQFKIDCTWSMYGTYYITADSEDDARQIAKELPLPDDGYYLDDSFVIDEVTQLDTEDD